MSALRAVLALVVVAVFALAVAGVGTGHAPKNDPAPRGAALAASKARVARGGAMVAKGRKAFEAEGCDDCHAIAATGAKGKLGPRMDTQDDAADEIHNNIVKPRADIAKGFEAHLMPTDYAKRMAPDEIRAVVTFIKTASGSERPAARKPAGRDGDEG